MSLWSVAVMPAPRLLWLLRAWDAAPTVRQAALLLPWQPSGGNREISPVEGLLDGLVDAGILMDDDPSWVRSIILHAPVRGDRDSVTVRLVPVTPIR